MTDNPIRYPGVLTGHTDVWDRTVQLQAQRVMVEDQSVADRHSEAYLYVVALSQLLRGIEAIACAIEDSELRDRLDRFAAAHRRLTW